MSDPAPEHAERLPWLRPEWLAGAEAWIRAQVETRGGALAGEIEQPHAQWWSTVLRVPTSEGDLYFKAVALPVHGFEPALTARLARLAPDRVPELVAVEQRLGWMLMRDGGTRLRELVRSPADLTHWEELLPLYAELQIDTAPSADELLALGVPDERLAGIPERFERLLADRSAVPLDLPGGVTSEQHARLRARVPDLAAECRELERFGIPETIQHDDLHDGNVFVRDGRYVVFDWGDSSISHPFHTLVVTLRSIAYRLDLEPGGAELERLRDAYLEPFARYGGCDELVAAFDLAYHVGTLARALAWHRFASAREPEFGAEAAEAVAYGLTRFETRGPIGSWR
jgi:Phosphotransferase enzyme family